MGTEFGVICERCGHKFTVTEGGGFFFYNLRCDRCGKSIEVTIPDDRRIRPRLPGDDDTEEQEQKRIEAVAGHCECGGKFTFDAPPRCPKCRSTQVLDDPDGPMICFD